MWIEKNEKERYNDSKVKGLRIIFKDGISDEERRWCKEFSVGYQRIIGFRFGAE